MPSEIRHILFQPFEVVEAIGEYYRKTGRAVPSGEVVHYELERVGQGSGTRLRMTIEDDRQMAKAGAAPLPEAEKLNLIMEGAELAAALIMHCRAQRIPLPANATKALETYGGQLCLAFTRTSGQKLHGGGKKKMRLVSL